MLFSVCPLIFTFHFIYIFVQVYIDLFSVSPVKIFLGFAFENNYKSYQLENRSSYSIKQSLLSIERKNFNKKKLQ